MDNLDVLKKAYTAVCSGQYTKVQSCARLFAGMASDCAELQGRTTVQVCDLMPAAKHVAVNTGKSLDDVIQTIKNEIGA